jgi:nitrate reductase NapE
MSRRRPWASRLLPTDRPEKNGKALGMDDTTERDKPSTYQEELRTFLFLTVVTAPLLAVMIVGGWGFLVWMYQLLTGDLPG